MSQKKIIQQLEQCEVFLVQNEKFTQMSSTRWSLVQRQDKLYVHDGAETYKQLSKEIIRIQYKEKQSLFSNNSNSYLALLIPNNSELNDLLQFKFGEFNIVIVDLALASKKSQENIRSVCGKNIGQQFNSKGNSKTSSIGFKVGGFFGAINSFVAKPSQKINEQASTKIKEAGEIKDKQLSEQGKNNWNKVKQKVGQINQGAAQVIKPAKNKLSSFTNSIGQKFNKSENSFIKGFRQFGNNLKDSLNDGYKNYRKSTNEQKPQQVSKQLKAPQSERQLK